MAVRFFPTWRPMDSAPRDGTWFIVIDALSKNGTPECVNWPPKYAIGKWHKRHPNDNSNDEWCGKAIECSAAYWTKIPAFYKGEG